MFMFNSFVIFLNQMIKFMMADEVAITKSDFLWFLQTFNDQK